ncbi:MAG: winged helix-turn-helix domain-containing protein [Candidatus Bathyarchaeota archaeon]|nr:winged helix-turn-helix domain-containing protein [Candidatus Bathyarchaeota archaeon]
MRKTARRDTLKIYNDLLSILNSVEYRKNKFPLTTISLKLNVPFDRFKSYLSDLNHLGLIDNETSPNLTEKGREYLAEYKKIIRFMDDMGITHP